MTKTDDTDVRAQTDTGSDETPPAPQMSNLVRLWRYRRVLLAAAVLGAGLTGVVHVTSPTEHAASLRFHLLFRGAGTGKYPSGERFSPEDIIAGPALHEVYEQNNLSRFASFDQFQYALYVAPRPSGKMMALDALYAVKLANRKLTAVDQRRLEREYESKRAALLNGVSYELRMDMSTGLADLPDGLHEKVLRDILKAWATQAVQLRGALRYSPGVLTKHVLPTTILDEDPLVAADMLRQKTNGMLDAVDALAELPGARTYRPSDDKLSLDEIRSNLNDVLGANILPTIQLVCTADLPHAGILRHQQVAAYVQSAAAHATRRQKQAANATKALQMAYALTQHRKSVGEAGTRHGQPATVPATVTIPQFGDSFIDRLLYMAAESESKNALFRQEYTDRIAVAALAEIKLDREVSFYSDTFGAIETAKMNERTNTPPKGDELTALVKGRITDAYGALLVHVEQIDAIYTQLSSTNLNPPAELYSATQPAVTSSSRAVSTTKLMLYLVTFVAGLVFLASVGCLYYDRVRALKPDAP